MDPHIALVATGSEPQAGGRLLGMVAIATDATPGIGEAIARAFAREGDGMAAAATFLASADTDYLHGARLPLDGGMTA